MTVKEIVAELRKPGTAQTKKTWMNHFAEELCFDVRIEDMKKIRKFEARSAIGKKRKSPKC